MKKYKIIIDFLKIIEANHEAQRYLKLFQKGNPTRFAIIKIGGKAMDTTTELIAMDLAYLCKLNLYPIVIHGGGTQIDRVLSESGIKFKKIEGLRVTTRKQISIIQKVLNHINSDIVRKIKGFNGSAIGLTDDIFIADKYPDERFGYVGVVKKVNVAPIIRAIKHRKIPVVSCLGFDEEGRVYNINADTAAKALVIAIRPKKYVLITEESGIRNRNLEIISNVNLSEELEEMRRNDVLTGGMLHKIKEIKSLLEQIKYNLPVQITSGKGLLRELFTDKGSGTFIKLGGNIREYKDYNKTSKEKLKKLIEKSFNKTLREDYFKEPVSYIFLDKKYRGVAIVRTFKSFFYLDKFCVRKEAQGEGIASDLWYHLTSRCKKVFWRARPSNSINSWYYAKSGGMMKFDKWYLFWIDLNEVEIREAKDYILNLEDSFLSRQ
jgi:acetylglutamate kinase